LTEKVISLNFSVEITYPLVEGYQNQETIWSRKNCGWYASFSSFSYGWSI